MRDPHATGDQEDGAVGSQGIGGASVRAFDQRADVVHTAIVGEGFLEDGVCEAGAAAHDEGDRGLRDG